MVCFVYHIHLEGMQLDQGYVGISINPLERWAAHSHRKENPILSASLKKHGQQIKHTILSAHDTVEEALWQEYTLRPFDKIGWNLVKGGGMPPAMGGWNKGRETSQETRNKQSAARKGKYGGEKHPRSKLANIYSAETGEIVASRVVISVWAKDNGYHQAHLSTTATGKLKQHKGLYARYV